MSGKILVPVFVDAGRAAKGSLAVLSEASVRAAELGDGADALVVGRDIAPDLLSGLGRYGASKVFSFAGDPRLSEQWVTAICGLLTAGEHGYVVLAGGPLALVVGGGVAARCRGGLLTDVTELRVQEDQLVVEKAVFRDHQRAVAGFTRGPGVVVARAGAFAAVADADRDEAIVEVGELAPACGAVEILHSGGVDDPGRQLALADVIVTGGRGLGAAERFTVVEELAEVLAQTVGDSAVGATRAVVDAGWRSEDAQVGLTGRTVSPRLYVAVAVSGAPQHRTGMESSERILAINSDDRAPIFKISDLGVVFDYQLLLPALTHALRERGAAT
jgi:electron transfer flavoprotein alpha subunit